jgi:Bacterial dnaA protein helix-turn-helix
MTLEECGLSLMGNKIKVEDIYRCVAKYYDISVNDLLSERREKGTILARHISMYLAKKLTLSSLPTIGRMFNRDHTTIIHSVRKVDALILSDETLAKEIMEIRTILGSTEDIKIDQVPATQFWTDQKLSILLNEIRKGATHKSICANLLCSKYNVYKGISILKSRGEKMRIKDKVDQFWTEENLAKLLTKWNSGGTSDSLAPEFECSSRTIERGINIHRSRGSQLRGRKYSKRITRDIVWDGKILDDEGLRNVYRLGFSTREIARRAGVSRAVVWSRLNGGKPHNQEGILPQDHPLGMPHHRIIEANADFLKALKEEAIRSKSRRIG